MAEQQDAAEDAAPPAITMPVECVTLRGLLLGTFTGRDNKTIDIGRVQWFFMTIAYMAFSGIAVWRGQAFDPVQWATGAGAILALGGAGLALKKETEPR